MLTGLSISAISASIGAIIGIILYANRILTLPYAVRDTLEKYILSFEAKRRNQRLNHLSFLDKPARNISRAISNTEVYPDDPYPSMIPDSERVFYEEFSKRLAGATLNILNCGDGFNMARPASQSGSLSSREKADILDGAIINALRSNEGLIYKRFQIVSACNINWISRMISMKEEFGDRFKLYINQNFDHIGCFCGIDTQRANCVFEWQLVSGRHYMDGSLSRGFGFTYANRKICGVVDQMFREIDQAPKTNTFHERGNPFSDIDRSQMDCNRLRKLQRFIWNKRVKEIYNDPDKHRVGDVEIFNALDKRGLNVRRFKLSDMDFNESDFPVIPYEEGSMERSLERWKRIEGIVR